MLNKGDRVVTAWAEEASGPGFYNPLVWVLVRDQFGQLREEALQPDEQGDSLKVLHAASAAITRSMTAYAKMDLHRAAKAAEQQP